MAETHSEDDWAQKSFQWYFGYGCDDPLREKGFPWDQDVGQFYADSSHAWPSTHPRVGGQISASSLSSPTSMRSATLSLPFSPTRYLRLRRPSITIKMASSSSAATIADPAAPPADLSTRQKPGSSVRDQLPHELNSVLRPDDWGTRVLKDDSEVFTMNAWCVELS